MAIPVYLQQFKAAGIYRVVFDKSTILNTDTQILRLVVGYSEKGPFNIPVYVKDPSEFKAYFGEPSKKLEKRGIYFHRLALQMLQVSPILCLNLKKFAGETVDGSTISTDFNPKYDPIDTVSLNVEDIYNTVRFWELDAEKLNNLRAVNGTVLDQYINIATTNTKATSATYFIRKACGQKVAGYNITVHNWYSDRAQEIPEYLEGKENNLISDFFAEIYVFNGKFTAKQVLASETLKNYFIVTDELDENDEPILQLREKVYDAFGDPVDTLDALYKDETSGALGHWIGSLIPDFKNKQGAYAALDVLFNNDHDVHNMMMSFNRDMLDEEVLANIDLSGRLSIPTNKAVNTKKVPNTSLSLAKIFKGEAKTNLMGNLQSPVIADKILFGTNVYNLETKEAVVPLDTNGKTKIMGTLYVANVTENAIPVVVAKEFHKFITKKVQAEGEETFHYERDYTTEHQPKTEVVLLQKYPDAEDLYKYQETIQYADPATDEWVNAAEETEALAKNESAVDYFEGKIAADEQGKEIEGNPTWGDTIYEHAYQITLMQVGGDETEDLVVITLDEKADCYKLAAKLGVKVKSYYKEDDIEVETGIAEAGQIKALNLEEGFGTYWKGEDAFTDADDPLAGPEKVITSITRLEGGYSTNYDIFTDIDENLKVNFLTVDIVTNNKYVNALGVGEDSVYGSSVSFIDYIDENWVDGTDEKIGGVTGNPALVSYQYWDKSLMSVLQEGDCLLAKDGSVDYDGDGDPENDKDFYYDNVYVQEMGTEYYTEEDVAEEAKIKSVHAAKHEVGDFKFHYIIFTALPLTNVAEFTDGENASETDIQNNYLVRVDGSLNQEIGLMRPQYLKGYVYKNDRPEGTGMYAKVKWQEFILSALTDYKGLRTGLLNKSEIDYRYVIDTFESFPVTGLKDVLSYLCKEKQSAFCIANFPSVKSFIKCPYTSFTDSKGIFNVEYVVKGLNKKKAASMKFSLPQESDGASFIAFYSPLKFSDGYIDSIIPSAGLVSNLFIEKYMSRQPYYIVAGPNYGRIVASGLVGPDYRYSMDELQVIEPFGVNVMVYRPNFGTFINANQTAKQTPLSALSKVHVRELVIYLQDEIEKVLQAYQWEFNNQRTRNAILDKANNICELIMANGGLQAYRNIMDESNNTPEIIDNEMAILSTHIEPGMGCGKMVQELTLYRTGQMKAALSD